MHDRDLVQIRFTGLPPFQYALPSLHAAEVAYVEGIERRLASAAYDPDRVVPIYWDTECTGLGQALWFDMARAHRIVQIAALSAGGREFKVNINPYPLEMEARAAEAINLHTHDVWLHPEPLQTGVAKFLEFCLDVSAEHGNATPMLVAHNARFDIGMLQTAAWQSGMHVPGTWGSLCTCSLAKQLAKEHPVIRDHGGLKLGQLAKKFGSDVRAEDLHDALVDTRQLPVIVAGFAKHYGHTHTFLTDMLTRPIAEAGHKLLNEYNSTRHERIMARLRCDLLGDKHALSNAKAAALRRLSAASPPASPAQPVFAAAAREDGHSALASSSPQKPPKPSQAESAAAVAAAAYALQDLELTRAATARGTETTAPLPALPDRGKATSKGQGKGLGSKAALNAVLARAPPSAPDPFLSLWRNSGTGEPLPLLEKGAFAATSEAWSPFTVPLASAGLPKKLVRSAMLDKLQEAGFETLLDLVRHTPRLEKRLNPSVHVEQLTDKVAVTGSILSVGKPNCGPVCSFLPFKCLLDLTADDGLVIQKPFSAVIFTGRGVKGRYKLELDEKRLHGMLRSDATAVLVGRFKEARGGRSGEQEYSLNVTEYNAAEEGFLSSQTGDEARAMAIYPARREVRETDFARLMPLISGHLSEVAGESGSDSGPDEPLPGDFVPRGMLAQRGLMPWLDAVAIMHSELGSDVSTERRAAARTRFVFNEVLLLSLMMLHHRAQLQGADEAGTPVVCSDREMCEAGVAALPFELTAAQARCVGEILRDMAAPLPMLRLLQGDVGSGKTAVAFLAALAAIGSGYQVAVLVPNEVLAQQHQKLIAQVSERMPAAMRPRVELVVGKMGIRRRKEVREQLAAGQIDILLGTTALNNDKELFSRLGLVVIDEQHRFGVRQRAQLVKKDPDAAPPHVLYMTATPIPRTIAMTMMSHMTTSLLDELPPGRLPVQTSIMRVKAGSTVGDASGARTRVLARIEEELERGGSVFWVFPLVNESEHFEGMGSANQTYELLQQAGGALKEHALMITGPMKSEQKELVLGTFKSGARRLLISTVVIEVGIDVPDATLMVVEHAERFGLLQLHQLRGRVGRSDKQSACVLVTSAKQSVERLQVLEGTNDGHQVAMADLQLRGAGQLFGQRQSGPAEMGLGALLSITDLATDEAVLLMARECAAELVKQHGFRGLPPALLAALSGYRMTNLLALKMQDIDVHM